MIVIGLATRGMLLAPLLTMIGAVFAVLFPVLLAGIAFRQLVGNRRIVMIPDVRVFAAGGLFLLALVGTAISLVLFATVATGDSTVGIVSFGLLAFSAISLYLVLSQWLVTHAFGIFALAFLPLLALRLGNWTDPVFVARVTWEWPWLALALGGWAWLLVASRRVASRRKTLPRGLDSDSGFHHRHAAR